ncbi:hypothetical protein RRF57_001727 [Xylaria bambusicola]|uniref:Uncharacterized protein n=1 Tax=Xylaria bambusicola TaxID=326684 RepID=A0AAN7UHN6_9PEZI
MPDDKRILSLLNVGEDEAKPNAFAVCVVVTANAKANSIAVATNSIAQRPWLRLPKAGLATVAT